VPLQGQWQRIQTPVRATTPRERRIVWAFSALLGAAAIATIIVAITTSGPSVPAGCIQVEVPSTMGGGTTRLCDQNAASFCRSPAAHSAPLDATALPKCREAGYQ
jgi:hypothetical protein